MSDPTNEATQHIGFYGMTEWKHMPDIYNKIADINKRFTDRLKSLLDRQSDIDVKISDAFTMMEHLACRLDIHKEFIDAQHASIGTLANAMANANDRIDSLSNQLAMTTTRIDGIDARVENEEKYGSILENLDERIALLAMSSQKDAEQLAMTTKRLDDVYEHLESIREAIETMGEGVDVLADRLTDAKHSAGVAVASQGDAADAPTWIVRDGVKYARMHEIGVKGCSHELLLDKAIKDAISQAMADCKPSAGVDLAKARGLLITMSGLIHEIMRARNTSHYFFAGMNSAMGAPVAEQWYASACKAVANAASMANDLKSSD